MKNIFHYKIKGECENESVWERERENKRARERERDREKNIDIDIDILFFDWKIFLIIDIYHKLN